MFDQPTILGEKCRNVVGNEITYWIDDHTKEVRDSYFHHAYDRGGGGHGYGVTMNTHVTSCLVGQCI